MQCAQSVTLSPPPPPHIVAKALQGLTGTPRACAPGLTAGLLLLALSAAFAPQAVQAQGSVPPKPTNFSASPKSGGVTLQWKIPGRAPFSTSEPHGITRWEYSQKTSGSAGAAPWTVMTGSNIRFDRRTAVYSYDVSSGITPGDYVFTVRAVNTDGNGVASDEATSGTGLLKPTALRITAVENSITLRWTAATDASITRWEYRSKNKERGERAWFPIKITGSDASTRTVSFDKSTTSQGGLHGGVGQYQVRSVIVTRQSGRDVTSSVSPWSDTAEVSIINTDNLALVFGGSPVSATGTTSVSYNASVARNASVTYTVALSEAALPYIVNPVVVTLTSSATTRVRVSPSTLTFTADNAQTPQTVTLTGVAAGSATIGHAARFPGLALLDPAGTITVTVTEPVTGTVPAKPTGFGATASGTQVALAWTDPGDASITRWQYRQKVGSGHYGTWTDVPGATATTTGHTVTGLRPGGVYTFELRAVNAGGSGPASAEATATIVPPVPAAPVYLRATAGPRQVTLNWRNPRDATITGWQYRHKTTGNYGDWTDILDAAATSTGTRYTGTAPGLTAGTVYTFELRAVNVGGNSPASNEVSSTPTGGVPVKPTGLRVVMVAEDSVTLRWTATADSSITKWSFQAGRAFADGRIDWGGNWAGRIIAITGSAASTRTYTVDTSGLVDGLQYAFRVRSTNADGDSAWSPTSRVVGIVNSDNLAMTLSARTLTVDRGDTVTYTVALTAAAMPGFWGFGQRISFTPTSSDTATATVSPPSLVFTQSTVSTTQMVTVTGVKSGRATISHSFNLLDPYRIGVASGEISVTVTVPAPAKPVNFSATAGDRQVALSWDDPGDASITKYQYRQKVGSGDYGSWTDIDGATATTTRHTVTGLRPGVVYAYRIRAVNSTGDGTQSDEATATPTASTPALTLSGTADGTEGGNLSLTLTSDINVSGTLDVAFTVQGSTSTSDRDAAAADFNSGTLTGVTSASFNNGKSATVSLPLTDDGSVEGDEGFRISLATGSGYLVASGSGTLAGTLTDNDGIRLTAATGQDGTERGTLTLALSAVATTDGGTNYSTDASFSGVLGGLVWAYAGGTAVAGDFSTVPDSATFSSGTASVDFTVADDTDDAESYSIQLASVTGHAVVAASNAVSGMLQPKSSGVRLSATTLTVTEADAAGGTYTVVLTAQPSHAVTVTVAGFTGTDVTASPATLSFTSGSGGNWNMAQTVTVTADPDLDTVNDSVTLTHSATSTDGDYNTIVIDDVAVTVDDDDTPAVTLSATTLTVNEGDSAGGSYTVVLATQPIHDVTVTVAGFTGTDVTASPATLTFTSGSGGNWGTARTVTVTADQDLDAADDSVTLTHSATSTDGDYNMIDIDDVAVTVDDDDTPAVTLSATTLTVTEGDATGGAYTVVLATQPDADVTVTVDGFTGTDVMASPATLTFTSGSSGNWNMAQSVTVTAAADSDLDADSVTLTHSASGATGYSTSLNIADVDVTVTDVTPGQPTGLSAAASNEQVMLNWVAPGAGGTIVSWQYRQKEGSNAYGGWLAVPSSGAGTTSYTVTGLNNGAVYRFQVRAVGAGTNNFGAAAAEVSATLPPPKPTNFSASPRSGGVTLEWKIPGRAPLSTSEPHGIIRWEYSQKTSGSAGAAPWTVMTGSNIRFDRRTAVYSYDVSSGITPGEYVFTVRAINSGGNGVASDEATSGTGLLKPTALRITAVENSITLRWTAATDTSITRWEYRFKNKERGERGWRPFLFKNSEASTRTATLDKTTTLHGGVGQYQVRSVIVVRQHGRDVTSSVSPWSDTAEVSVINTDNLALVFGGSPVSATGTTSVSYTASVARNASVTYTVAVSEAALLYIVNPLVVTLTSSDTGKARVSPSTLTFTADNADTPQMVTLTGVAAGSATIGHAARFPGLALIDPAGTLAVTVTEPVTVTLPAKPTGFGATASGTQVALAWTDPSDASITGWQYRQKVDSGHYGTWTGIPGATATTTGHTITGLRLGGAYTFELRAVNAGGGGPASDEATATIAPAKPVNLRASAGPRQVTLSWRNPRVASITGWQYRQKTTGNYGGWTNIPDATATTTRHTVTGLTAGTAYTFELRAVNAGGNSPASDEAMATPTGGVPAKPTGLRVTAAEDSVTLNWTAYTDSTITGWSFQAGRVLRNYTDWGSVTAITGSAASTRTHTIDTSGLVDGVQYVYGVRSTNADGSSDWSTSPVVGIVNSDNLAMTLSASTLSVARGATVTYTVALTDAAVPGSGVNLSLIPTSSDTDTATVTPLNRLFTQSTAKTPQSFTVTGVKPGRATISHSIELVSPDRRVVSSGKISVTVTVPAPAKPVNFSATAGDRQVALRWDDPSDASITKYQYRQKVGAGSYGSWTDIDGATATTTRHTVTGLRPGVVYAYRIRAVNSTGDGTQSDEATATPTASTPALTLSGTADGTEGGNLSLTLTSDINVSGTLDVAFTVQGSTSTSDRDAAAADFNSGTLTGVTSASFNNGKSATVNLPLSDDGSVEGDEGFRISLAAGSGYLVASGSGTLAGTLTDNDGIRLTAATGRDGTERDTLTLALSAVATTDGGTNYSTDAGFSGMLGGLVWAYAGGTAVAGDFSTVPDSATFSSGTASVAFTVADDTDDAESYSIQLASVTGHAVVAASNAVSGMLQPRSFGVRLSATTLTVTEADAAGGTYTVVLIAQPSHDVTVTVAGFTGTDVTASPATLTFTSGVGGNWDTARTVTVTASGDLDAADDSVTLTHSATSTDGDYNMIDIEDVVVTVDDDDTPAVTLSATTLTVNEGDSAGGSYTVVLATQPVHDVTVTVAGFTGTDVTASPATLTFTSGGGGNWSTARTVTVTADQDLDAANDSVTLTHTATSTDSGYQSIDIDDVAVTVDDDDTPAVTLNATTLTVTEGDSAGGSYLVALATQPSHDVTVTVAGFTGSDVTASPATLTFTSGVGGNWSTAKTVTVTADQDLDAADDSVTLTHSATSTDGDYNTIVIKGVVVTVSDDDDPGVTLNATTLTVTEGDSAGGSYTVVLDTQPDADVTVTVAGFASTDVMASPATLTFTSGAGGNWGTARTVTVTAAGDTDTADDSVTLTHTASGATGYSTSLNIADVDVTVTDVTPGQPTGLSAAANDEQVTLNWVAPSAGGTIVSWQYRQKEGSNAYGGWLAVPSSGAGTTSYTVTGLNNGTVYRFQVRAVGAGTNNFGAAAAEVSSTPAPPELTLSGTANGTEGGNLSFTLSSDINVSSTLDVAFTVQGSTSATDTDAVAADFNSGTLTGITSASFNNGRTATVSLPLSDDGSVEGDEGFRISLATGSGYSVASGSPTLAGTLTDNDGIRLTAATSRGGTEGGMLTLALSAVATTDGGTSYSTDASFSGALSGLVWAYTGGTAEAADFSTVPDSATFSSGTASVDFTVADDADAAESYSIQLTSVTGHTVVAASNAVSGTLGPKSSAVTLSATTLTVTEGDGTGGSYTVVLAVQPSHDVTVTVAGFTGTEVTASPATLSFTSGVGGNWSTARTVTVTAEQDLDAVNDSVTLTHSATSTDGDYDTIVIDDVAVTVDDDDNPGVTLSATTLTVEEGAATGGGYTVVLATQPTADVTLTVSGFTGTDVTASPATLTFTSGSDGNWSTAQTVTVTADQDFDADDDSVTLTHSATSTDGDYNTIVIRDVVVTVDDDDTPAVTLSATTLTVEEGDSTGSSYTVVLATLPAADVTVTVAGFAGTDVTASPAELTFTSGAGGNWDTAQTVTVTAREDDGMDDESVTLRHTASGATDYSGSLDIASVVVMVDDDDAPGVTPSTTTLTVNEGDGAGGSYTVVLDTQPDAAVTVSVGGFADTDVTASPATLTFSTTDWDTVQRVTVTAAVDSDTADDSVTLTHSASGATGYSDALTIADVDVSVSDTTPGQPASVIATAGDGQATLFWIAPGTGGPIADWQYRATTQSSGWSGAPWTEISGSDATTTRHTVSGLSNAVAYRLQLRAIGSTGTNNVGPASEEATVTPTATPVSGVTVGPPALSLREGGSGNYVVVLNARPDNDVLVTVGGATAKLRVQGSPLTFSTADWALPQTVTVTAVEDDDDTADESVTLTHTVSGYGSVTTASSVSVTVTDNDRAEVTVAPRTLSLAEGATGVYTLVLNTRPANAVLVTVGGATAKLTVQGSPLTFSTTDWASPQTVTVLAQQDADGSDERVTLTHAVSGYGPVTTATSVVVSITDDDEVTEQTPATRAERVNQAVLPHVVESITAGTLSAVTGRIDAAIAGTPAATGNALNLAALAARYGQTHASGTDIPLWEALNGTRFALPLSAAGEGGGALPNLAIWGSSNWLSLSGSQATGGIAWDGGVWGTALGADLRLRPNLLAGVSISHARGSIDTTVTDGSGSIAGDYDTRTTSVYPYLAWSLSERLSVWVTGGYGKGRLEIKEADAPTRESDLDLAGGAAGGRGVLLETTDLIHGGVTRFAFTGEGAYTQVKVAGGDAEALPELEVDTHRLRLAMQGSHEHGLPDGSSLRPAIEVGMRHDGGSGDNTGFGVETGGTLSYLHPALGLTLELRGRTLLEHEADRNEWGIGGLVRIDPNTRGRGLFLSLEPSRGSTESRIAQPYQYAGHASAVGGATGGYRLDAELGHGFGLRRHGTDATLTPYVGMALSARDAHSFRLGGRYHIGAAFKLDLEALRRQHRTQRPDHSLLLRGTLHW